MPLQKNKKKSFPTRYFLSSPDQGKKQPPCCLNLLMKGQKDIFVGLNDCFDVVKQLYISLAVLAEFRSQRRFHHFAQEGTKPHPVSVRTSSAVVRAQKVVGVDPQRQNRRCALGRLYKRVGKSLRVARIDKYRRLLKISIDPNSSIA